MIAKIEHKRTTYFFITRAIAELESDDEGNEGDDDDREEKRPYSAERVPIKIPFSDRKSQAKMRSV